MYIYIYIYIYFYLCIYEYICTHTRTHAHTQRIAMKGNNPKPPMKGTSIYTWIYICTLKCTWTHACTHAHTQLIGMWGNDPEPPTNEARRATPNSRIPFWTLKDRCAYIYCMHICVAGWVSGGVCVLCLLSVGVYIVLIISMCLMCVPWYCFPMHIICARGGRNIFPRHRWRILPEVLGDSPTPPTPFEKILFSNFGAKIRVYGAKTQISGAKNQIRGAKIQIFDRKFI